jgi:hypothetical protein
MNEAQMSHLDDDRAEALGSLVDVFNAAWVVVGRQAYSLHREEEEQLRLDLASCIGRLVASGVDNPGELVRRSISRFLH